MLELIRPSPRYRDSFLEAVRELPAREHRSLLYADAALAAVERDFDGYVAELLARETAPPPPLVPDTIWWGVVGERVVGRIAFRHELNDYLRRVGGHIGYAVRPSERRRGHATAMLRLALATDLARPLGEVLITCDEDNLASIRVIERNGGVRCGHHDPGEGGPRTLHFRVPIPA